MKARQVHRIAPRKGRGTVVILAALLTFSAALRIVTGSDMAWAQNNPGPADPAETVAEAEPSAVQASEPVKRAEVGTLLRALQDREAQLVKKEEQIRLRAKALSVADAEIEKRMNALQQMEEDLRKTLALADGAAENDLTRLTAVYESMKPKDAAALFETMEPDFAAGFLGRMTPQAAAAVMAGLTPETAYAVSAILAGRNATVPKS